jgi:competence protein ComEC
MICVPIICALVFVTVRSLEGLHPPRIGQVDGVAVLISDPQRDGSGIRVTTRVTFQGKHLRATAFSKAGSTLSQRSAGEHIRIKGSVRGWLGEPPSWAVSRHLSGNITLTTVEMVSEGSPPAQLANAIRRTMVRGARSIPTPYRQLFMGFVLGDNRDQPVEVADDFRAAGLSHLLVVSGQNVAFVLVALNPLLRRMNGRWRFAVGLGVLLFFGLLTRFEPSVLRAGTMAAVTLWSKFLGRPQPAIRVLSMSVMVLLLIDPLLSRSTGFGLSVSATAGLALLSGPIERRLPGPKWMTAPLAATLAAQIATFPILVGLGGVHPLAAVANLVALPLAEPVMVWGVLIGVPAGLIGDAGSWVLHLPTLGCIAWITFVARSAAWLVRALPVPIWWPLPLLSIVTIMVAAKRYSPRPALSRRAQWWCVVALSVAASVSLVSLGRAPTCKTDCVGQVLERSGLTVTQHRGRVVVLAQGSVNSAQALRSLRNARVRRIDVLVVGRANGQMWRSLQPIRARHPVSLIIVSGQNATLDATPLVGIGSQDSVELGVGREPPFASVTCPKQRCEISPRSSVATLFDE